MTTHCYQKRSKFLASANKALPNLAQPTRYFSTSLLFSGLQSSLSPPTSSFVPSSFLIWALGTGFPSFCNALCYQTLIHSLNLTLTIITQNMLPCSLIKIPPATLLYTYQDQNTQFNVYFSFISPTEVKLHEGKDLLCLVLTVSAVPCTMSGT